MQCREILCRLCSLQTNLLIPFHHQCDVLLHQGHSFKELFFIRNCKCYRKKSEHRAASPNELVPHLAMRCLYQGVGVHLIKGQPGQSSTKLGHEMSLMWGTSDQSSTKHGHKMSLPVVGAEAGVGQGWAGVQLTKGQPA